jgi:hypothetical protein
MFRDYRELGAVKKLICFYKVVSLVQLELRYILNRSRLTQSRRRHPLCTDSLVTALVTGEW